jgi:hypothetical protein
MLALLLLAACIPKTEERPVSRPPATIPSTSNRETLQCHADLRREDVEFKILPDRIFDGGCMATGSVQLIDIGTPVTNITAMTCPLARQFARWTREAVQPAAEQWLGSRVARIESMGSYSCRPLNGQAGNKLSEHGRANAVDIGAFILADGRRITILADWNGGNAKVQGFLRAIHRAGCRDFQIGLGPDANSFHRDHLHFDMGVGPYCR